MNKPIKLDANDLMTADACASFMARKVLPDQSSDVHLCPLAEGSPPWHWRLRPAYTLKARGQAHIPA
ncbi:hypothetical protein GCM10009425_25530 [Pseudomonas asuensis]|uniref:Uncharacterized protein n=1 Tax=Pseudomonas asuensis TaxID=1825787 RepID=A0ABQ2GV27_9PSED|nr:hypothetical protein GCM10009425_25530 [Pseudomonas asuensis]